MKDQIRNQLREARTARQYTLQFIAAQAAIPIAILEALEAGDYRRIGSRLYVTRYGLEYAAFLDAGGDVILSGDDRELMLPRMLTMLQRRVRLGAESNETIRPFEGLIIYPLTKTVHVNGKPIDLTATEYNLVSILARQYLRQYPGVVTRKMFIDELRFGDERSANTFYVFMKRVRDKLPAPLKLITVRHVGYRLSNTD